MIACVAQQSNFLCIAALERAISTTEFCFLVVLRIVSEKIPVFNKNIMESGHAGTFISEFQSRDVEKVVGSLLDNIYVKTKRSSDRASRCLETSTLDYTDFLAVLVKPSEKIHAKTGDLLVSPESVYLVRNLSETKASPRQSASLDVLSGFSALSTDRLEGDAFQSKAPGDRARSLDFTALGGFTEFMWACQNRYDDEVITSD